MTGAHALGSGLRKISRVMVPVLLSSGCISLVFFILYEHDPVKSDAVRSVKTPPILQLQQQPQQQQQQQQQQAERPAGTDNAMMQKNLDKACMDLWMKKRPKDIYTPPVKANVYVEPNHNVFYCPVQKAGSSFWLRTLTAMMTQEASNPYELLLQHKKLLLHSLWEISMEKDQMKSALSSGPSFMFVREPFGRIYSAYVDKVYFPNKIYWPDNLQILALTIGKKTNGFDLTFADTVEFLMKLSPKELQTTDIHFRPMHALCNPCDVNYKFIGKLENFKADVDNIFDIFRSKFSDFNIKFNDFESESTMDDITRHVDMLFYMIVETKLKAKMSVYTILLRGWSDLHIRGYLSKHIPMPFSKAEAESVTRDMFMKAIEESLAMPADAEAVKAQREEAMVQAYMTVPPKYLKKLANLLKPDCELFSYDCDLDGLIKKYKSSDNSHTYLQGL